MKLEFDSVEDLDIFLNWADLYRAAGTQEPEAPQRTAVTPGERLTFTVGAGGGTSGVAFDTPPNVPHVSLDDKAPEGAGRDEGKEAPEAGKVAEPAKRKRRTKAEIDADDAAATDALAKETALAKAQETAADAAQPAAEGAKQPEGTNPFAQVAAAGTAPAEAQDSDPVEPTIVTPFQHITRGREFIGKHGLPKYNETFVRAELDANVMAYSAEQRAKHMAVMDEMDKA